MDFNRISVSFKNLKFEVPKIHRKQTIPPEVTAEKDECMNFPNFPYP